MFLNGDQHVSSGRTTCIGSGCPDLIQDKVKDILRRMDDPCLPRDEAQASADRVHPGNKGW